MGEKKKCPINRKVFTHIYCRVLMMMAIILFTIGFPYCKNYIIRQILGEVVQFENLEMERQILWQYQMEAGEDIWTSMINDRGELLLEGNEIVDLTELEKFSELKVLILRGTGVTDLTPLKSLKQLKSLCIDGGELKSLESIRELESLEYVILKDLPISSLEPLSSLKKLGVLRICHMPVTDISVLKTVKELKDFTMEGTQVRDVKVLSSMENLEKIYIQDCPIEEIGDFDMLEIRTLEIIHTNIDHLPAFPDTLSRLTLKQNKIDDFAQMIFPWNLYWLELSDLPPDTRLFPLKALEVCPELNNLILKNAGLKSLDGIHYILRLKCLDVSGNQIEDISELKEVSEFLTYVDLSGNPIGDFEALRSLENLEKLYVSQINLQDKTLQESLSQVKTENLDISDCGLEEIDFLQNAQHLRRLDLSNNHIKNWECLKNLENLEELNLSGNQVEDIRPAAECEKLDILYIAENQIGDISGFGVPGCERMAVLDLSGNPITSIGGLEKLKRLCWLNLSEISLGEMEEEKGREILKELVKSPYMDVLILQDCGLKDLEFITANIRVYKLVASNNQIEELPESWKRQNRLDKLELSGNPITGETLESEGGVEIRPGVYRMRGRQRWQIKIQEESEFVSFH